MVSCNRQSGLSRESQCPKPFDCPTYACLEILLEDYICALGGKGGKLIQGITQISDFPIDHMTRTYLYYPKENLLLL